MSPNPLSLLDAELLTVLYQCRLASTSQLHRLLTPRAETSRYVRRRLRLLADIGLVDAVHIRSHALNPEYAWFATSAAADLVEENDQITHRPYRMTRERAAGPSQLHALAVTEVGTVFVETARQRDDECSPLDWSVEIAHRTRDQSSQRFTDDHVITDAVLYYTTNEPDGRTHLRYFIEVDRATMNAARLARKIHAYGQYHRYVPANTANTASDVPAHPAWQETYPRFPKLLVVLTGKPRPQLERRIHDLRTYCAADPLLDSLSSIISAGITTLDRLRDDGPFTPVVTPLLRPDPTPTDVRMRPATGSH